MKNALSIKDLQNELGCSPNFAREIVMRELPHHNIAVAGSLRPCWRIRRKDFEVWMEARREAPGNERIEEFAKRYTR